MLYRLPKFINGLIRILSTLLAPVQCIACQKYGSYICNSHKKFLLKHQPQCYICHAFSPDSRICEHHAKSPLSGIIAGFNYTRLVQACVYESKYGSSYHLLSFFANQLLYDIQTHPALSYALDQDRLIISYIPMHWRKEHHIRGYNQAQKLAMYIAKELNVPCVNLCTKQEHTRSQTTFSREKRMKNQENMFQYAYDMPLLPNQTILVVDDILTTGSTLSEFANAVQEAGIDCALRGLCVARHG